MWRLYACGTQDSEAVLARAQRLRSPLRRTAHRSAATRWGSGTPRTTRTQAGRQSLAQAPAARLLRLPRRRQMLLQVGRQSLTQALAARLLRLPRRRQMLPPAAQPRPAELRVKPPRLPARQPQLPRQRLAARRACQRAQVLLPVLSPPALAVVQLMQQRASAWSPWPPRILIRRRSPRLRQMWQLQQTVQKLASQPMRLLRTLLLLAQPWQTPQTKVC